MLNASAEKQKSLSLRERGGGVGTGCKELTFGIVGVAREVWSL